MGIFYTKTGDDGYTSVIGDGRLPKFDVRVETLGTIDEANATLGLSRAATRSAQNAAVLLKAQRNLYVIMSEIAAVDEETVALLHRHITMDAVTDLESEIERVSALANIPNEFIVPGDCLSGAYLDIARTTVRRAERRVAELYYLGQIQNEAMLKYLNRLSSLCFALEIYENMLCGRDKESITKANKG